MENQKDPYVDFSPYKDEDRCRDNDKINNGIAVPCRICEDVFRRVRLTWRYCAKCKKGFCEGEHGSFAGTNVAFCIFCRHG